MGDAFLDKLVPRKFWIKSEVCGVEICYTDQEVIYYYSHLRNKNNKLELINSGVCHGKLDLPSKLVKSKIPIVIVLNGKGIIFKKIRISADSNSQYSEIVNQALPSLDIAEFFVQLYKQEDFTAYISFCRKSLVEDIIQELKDKNYELSKILIGAPSITGLQPLWSSFNTIQTSLHSVELTNGMIENISLRTTGSSDGIKIEGLSFPHSQSLAFAGGLSYLLQNQICECEDAEILVLQNKHIEKNKFKVLVVFLIGIAFTISATNVFFYTSYFDKNNKLESQLSFYQGKYDQINKLLTDYQKKKGLIENAGILSKIKLSEYADKIAKTIPDEVTLTEMYFNPKIDKDESEDSLITFQNKCLVLKGNCNKSLIINEWVNVLKAQKFIKDINLERFAYNNEGIVPNYEIKVFTE